MPGPAPLQAAYLAAEFSFFSCSPAGCTAGYYHMEHWNCLLFKTMLSRKNTGHSLQNFRRFSGVPENLVILASRWSNFEKRYLNLFEYLGWEDGNENGNVETEHSKQLTCCKDNYGGSSESSAGAMCDVFEAVLQTALPCVSFYLLLRLFYSVHNLIESHLRFVLQTLCKRAEHHGKIMEW